MRLWKIIKKIIQEKAKSKILHRALRKIRNAINANTYKSVLTRGKS